MRDNAKCAGNGCDLRDGCDRFVRPAVDRQEWLEPTWRPVFDFGRCVTFMRCVDMLPIVADPVEPHGGASEEGDGA